MVSLNRVLVAGNLTRDPESREVSTGRKLASFSLAINKHWRSANGEKIKDTTFLRIVVWNSNAEACLRYLKKGKAVLVEGRIENRSYTGKDGSEKKITQVVGDQVTFLSPLAKLEAEPNSELIF